MEKNKTTENNEMGPAIFYVPHADDDAIGMAAGIAEHLAAGRRVIVALIASGHNTALYEMMTGKAKCLISGKEGYETHPQYHSFEDDFKSDYDVHIFRKKEFESSVKSMGVGESDIFYAGDSGDCINNQLFETDDKKIYDHAVDMVKNFIRYMDSLFPNASHKFVSGPTDKFPSGNYFILNSTHKAIYEAAIKCCMEPPYIKDIRFYRVYAFWEYYSQSNPLHCHADFIFHNENEWNEIKHKALNCYKQYNPGKHYYALGYHSVPDLIDGAYNNNKTYIDLFPEKVNPLGNPFALQKHNGLFLEQKLDDNYIYANGNWIERYQEFSAIWSSVSEDGKRDRVFIAALGRENKQNYLSIVESGSQKGSICIGGAKEVFTVLPQGYNQIALMASNGKYLSVSKIDGKKLVLSDKLNLLETFTLMHRYSDCRISASIYNNQLFVFVRGANQLIQYKTYDGNTFSGWTIIGECFHSSPIAVNTISNDIVVFAQGENGELMYKPMANPRYHWFTTHLKIESPNSIYCDDKNDMHIFGKSDNFTKHIYMESGNWKEELLDSQIDEKHILSDITVSREVGCSGFLIYAKLSNSNSNWNKRQWDGGEKWSSWYPLAVTENNPDFASNPEIVIAENIKYIFVRGSDNYLWYVIDSDEYAFVWTKTPIITLTSPKAILKNNKIYVFAQNDNSGLYCAILDINDESWALHNSNICNTSDPELINYNNKIHLFVRGIVHNSSEDPNENGLLHASEKDMFSSYETLGEQII